MLPRGIGSWMYTDTHNAALGAGARVLMVQEPLEVLKRMLPIPETRRRGLAGAQRLQEAKEIRVVSNAGSDYVLRKDGRTAMYQCGVADEPGRWDHWPSGLVTCAPLEDSAEGTYSAPKRFVNQGNTKRTWPNRSATDPRNGRNSL
jgi:2,5-dihydroxypyridine 5,6-dioxygenase